MGSLLKKCNEDLFEAFFKSDNKPSPLVIAPKEPGRMHLKESDTIKVNFILIHNDQEIVVSFFQFLEELNHFNFFGAKARKTHSSINSLDSVLESAKIDYTTFKTSHLKWEEEVWLKFTTPATFRKNHIITTDFTADDFLFRIYNRIAELYKYYFSSDFPVRGFEIRETGQIINNQLFFSSKIIHNKKDYTGVLGNLLIRLPYNELNAWLLFMGSHIHVGNMANGGNGAYIVKEVAHKKITEDHLISNQSTDGHLLSAPLELIVSVNGSFIGKNKNKIRISKDDKTLHQVAFEQIQQIIVVAKNVKISRFVKDACERMGINILYK